MSQTPELLKAVTSTTAPGFNCQYSSVIGRFSPSFDSRIEPETKDLTPATRFPSDPASSTLNPAGSEGSKGPASRVGRPDAPSPRAGSSPAWRLACGSKEESHSSGPPAGTTLMRPKVSRPVIADGSSFP